MIFLSNANETAGSAAADLHLGTTCKGLTLKNITESWFH